MDPVPDGPQEQTDINSKAVARLTLPRGEAPTLCLAQPNGLGKQTEKKHEGQRPDQLFARVLWQKI